MLAKLSMFFWGSLGQSKLSITALSNPPTRLPRPLLQPPHHPRRKHRRRPRHPHSRAPQARQACTEPPRRLLRPQQVPQQPPAALGVRGGDEAIRGALVIREAAEQQAAVGEVQADGCGADLEQQPEGGLGGSWQ